MLLIRLRNATQMRSLIQSFSDGQDRQGEKVIKKKTNYRANFFKHFCFNVNHN